MPDVATILLRAKSAVNNSTINESKQTCSLTLEVWRPLHVCMCLGLSPVTAVSAV